jgi:hypothetical protein
MGENFYNAQCLFGFDRNTPKLSCLPESQTMSYHKNVHVILKHGVLLNWNRVEYIEERQKIKTPIEEEAWVYCVLNDKKRRPSYKNSPYQSPYLEVVSSLEKEWQGMQLHDCKHPNQLRRWGT